jgi:AraC family transcriptional activator of pobA
MKQIANYAGLYGETNARPDSNYIFSERIETRSRTFNWVIPPHVHTQLYQIFFVESGALNFQEATRQTPLEGACVLFVPPTALHGLSYTPSVSGRILTISDVVVERFLAQSAAMSLTFDTIQHITNFEAPYSFDWILNLIEQIDTELFSDAPEKQAMLQVLVNQLFIALFRLVKSIQERSILPENGALFHFSQFQKLIKQGDYTKTIPQYAQDLGITPVHLNRVCQSVSEQTASQLVQAFLVEEAKKYLRYTSYSVSEISYLLKFEYPNYFARLFKKHTGLSPSEFREKN